MFKMKTSDYELMFEYDSKEELEAYLKMAQETHSKIQEVKENYDYVKSRIEKQAEEDYGDRLNFFDLEYKFVNAKKKTGKVSKSTYKAYRSTFLKLRDYFRKTPISEITMDDYEAFRDYLIENQKLKNKTINNHMNYINKFLDFAVSRKLIPENNLKGLEGLKEEVLKKENFTDEEMKKILTYDFEESYKNFFLIASYTGMRLGEIHQLTNDDIKENDDGIFYFDIKASKSNAGIRQVPIHREILETVLEINFPIFKQKTKDATQKAVNRRLYQVINKNSTKSFHTFRGKFIEKALNANPKDVVIIQEIVGHSKGDKIGLTVDNYAKGFSLELKSKIVNSVSYNLKD